MTVIPQLVQEFTRKNEKLSERTERLFAELLSDARSRWLFCNTLSYMEHIGSYKIMASQQRHIIDYSTLKHLNEETGHAVLFKRHAERFSGEKLDYDRAVLIAPAFARAYFSQLEVSMIRYFGRQAEHRTIYLYMSLIVEFRAVWAYEILARCIAAAELDFSLAKLLAEEQGHLNSMVRRLDADGQYARQHIEYFWRVERTQFIRLMDAIERHLESEKFSPDTKTAAAPLTYTQA